jgi:hypothetical protein
MLGASVGGVGGFLIAAYQSSLIPAYAEICSKGAQAGKEHCASYNSALVVFWHVAKFFDEHNAAFGALATIVIAVFLVKVTNKQARLTQQTIDLARDEFIATHRPRVIVRFIATSFLDSGHRSIDVHVANIGAGPATIQELGCGLARRRGNNWLTRGVTGDPEAINPVVLLKSGERYVFEKAASIIYGDAEIFDEADVGNRAINTCAFGVIRYSDENGVERETGFFRIYDASSEKFIPSQDQGEEYQD